jgi:hypothetical protein
VYYGAVSEIKKEILVYSCHHEPTLVGEGYAFPSFSANGSSAEGNSASELPQWLKPAEVLSCIYALLKERSTRIHQL